MALGDLESGDFFSTELVAMQEKQVQMGFVRKVYGILAAQLVATVLIAAPFVFFIPQEWSQQNFSLGLVSSFMALGVIIAGTCKPSLFKTYPQNYLFTALFTVFESITIGFIVSCYTADSVILVFLLTAATVGALTVYAWKTENDFTDMGGYLVVALITLCLVGFIMAFFPAVPFMQKIYAGAGALLFGGYIVYDTQLIIGGKHRNKFAIDDYVFAAINIYLDVINEFLYLLELFGDRR